LLLLNYLLPKAAPAARPADQLVAKIEKEVKDKPVYILAYHVDYWDRLGLERMFSVILIIQKGK